MTRRQAPAGTTVASGDGSRFSAIRSGHTPAPAKPVTVAHYLVTLADMGRKPTTLQAILAAIADGHKRRRLDDPTRDPIVRKTLAGIKQARKEAGKPGPRQARGLTAEHLKAIRETIFQPRLTSGGLMESEARARKRGLRNLAVISVMRDALLRQAEAVNLRGEDISFTDDGGALVRVRHSKTSDNAASLYIRRTAAQALREITPEHPDPQARVFGLRRSETVAWIIQRETEAAGLGEGFSGHSCRVGMAQDLAAAGAEPRGHHAGGTLEVGGDTRPLHRAPSGAARCGRQLAGNRVGGKGFRPGGKYRY